MVNPVMYETGIFRKPVDLSSLPHFTNDASYVVHRPLINPSSVIISSGLPELEYFQNLDGLELPVSTIITCGDGVIAQVDSKHRLRGMLGESPTLANHGALVFVQPLNLEELTLDQLVNNAKDSNIHRFIGNDRVIVDCRVDDTISQHDFGVNGLYFTSRSTTVESLVSVEDGRVSLLANVPTTLVNHLLDHQGETIKIDQVYVRDVELVDKTLIMNYVRDANSVDGFENFTRFNLRGTTGCHYDFIRIGRALVQVNPSDRPSVEPQVPSQPARRKTINFRNLAVYTGASLLTAAAGLYFLSSSDDSEPSLAPDVGVEGVVIPTREIYDAGIQMDRGVEYAREAGVRDANLPDVQVADAAPLSYVDVLNHNRVSKIQAYTTKFLGGFCKGENDPTMSQPLSLRGGVHGYCADIDNDGEFDGLVVGPGNCKTLVDSVAYAVANHYGMKGLTLDQKRNFKNANPKICPSDHPPQNYILLPVTN